MIIFWKKIWIFLMKSLEEILSPRGTGNILLEELQLGISLKNVLMVFSFDEQYGDIVFSFPESEILKDKMHDNKLRLKKIVHYLVGFRINHDIPKILIGYEPATDEDTLLIEIDNTSTNYDNEIENLNL